MHNRAARWIKLWSVDLPVCAAQRLGLGVEAARAWLGHSVER